MGCDSYPLLIDPIDRMIGDALEDMAQIGCGVEAVEFGGAEEPRVERSRSILAARMHVPSGSAISTYSRRPLAQVGVHPVPTRNLGH